MANIASAKKRARQSARRRLNNMAQRSQLRTYIKNVRLAVERKDKEAAQQAFRKAMSVIDKVAGKGIIHKATAARYKSRLSARVKALDLAAASSGTSSS